LHKKEGLHKLFYFVWYEVCVAFMEMIFVCNMTLCWLVGCQSTRCHNQEESNHKLWPFYSLLKELFIFINVQFFLNIIYFPIFGCPEYFHWIIYATTFVLRFNIYFCKFGLCVLPFTLRIYFRRDCFEFSALWVCKRNYNFTFVFIKS
jgi:hypothetical protein